MAKKAEQNYTISIRVNGKDYSASGDTLDEAISGIESFSPKTRAVVVVTEGKVVSKPMLFNIPQINRLFYPGMTGLVQRTRLAKRFAMMV